MIDLPPLVSIVLPTYNGSRYLADSIKSCLAQTYGNWELIIVDDCSTDDTPKIIEQIAANDPRVCYIRNVENQRLPRSLNIGFQEAKGQLFTWTSDDNLFEPHAIATLVAGIEQGYDFVYADQMIIDDEGVQIGTFKVQPPEQLFEENVVNACFLYRREVHEALGGYDPNRFLVEDWQFWVRAASQFKLGVVAGVLYRYRHHAGSLSSTRKQQVVEQTIWLKKEYALPHKTKAERPSYLLALADQASRIRNRKLQRSLAWSAILVGGLTVNFKWACKHLLGLLIT